MCTARGSGGASAGGSAPSLGLEGRPRSVCPRLTAQNPTGVGGRSCRERGPARGRTPRCGRNEGLSVRDPAGEVVTGSAKGGWWALPGRDPPPASESHSAIVSAHLGEQAFEVQKSDREGEVALRTHNLISCPVILPRLARSHAPDSSSGPSLSPSAKKKHPADCLSRRICDLNLRQGPAPIHAHKNSVQVSTFLTSVRASRPEVTGGQLRAWRVPPSRGPPAPSPAGRPVPEFQAHSWVDTFPRLVSRSWAAGRPPAGPSTPVDSGGSAAWRGEGSASRHVCHSPRDVGKYGPRLGSEKEGVLPRFPEQKAAELAL